MAPEPPSIVVALERLKAAGPAAAEAASRFHPVEAPFFAPGCCDDELDELQSRLKHPLPSDYVHFLKSHRRVRALDVHNGYDLFSPMKAGMSPGRAHVPNSAGVVEERRILTIGGDGTGNLFLLDLHEPHAVLRWDHEHPLRFDDVAINGVSEIASSFSAFLDRIAQDWEQFARGNNQWSYLSG